MNSEYSYNIDNVFNIFSSLPIDILKQKYHIDKYCYLNQIHSNKVLVVDYNYVNNTNGDAMITNVKNIALFIRTADCIPILLYDNVTKVIALVHAGWKGTLNNIVNETIIKMVREYHSQSKNINVYIYPSIRQCHFEVENDVYAMFKNNIANIDKYVIQKDNKYYIDLVAIIKDNLNMLGVSKINDCNICTYCHHDKYYSYRYNHTDLRNYLIAMIKE